MDHSTINRWFLHKIAQDTPQLAEESFSGSGLSTEEERVGSRFCKNARDYGPRKFELTRTRQIL